MNVDLSGAIADGTLLQVNAVAAGARGDRVETYNIYMDEAPAASDANGDEGLGVHGIPRGGQRIRALGLTMPRRN